NRAFFQSISIIGADVLYVERFAWFNRTQLDWLRQRNRQPITLTQVRAVEKQMTQARATAPFTATQDSVKYKNRSSTSVTIIGTTDQFQFTSGSAVNEGRFISGPEADGGRPVTVLGFQVATNLFPNDSPLGKKLRIGQQMFEVVGV